MADKQITYPVDVIANLLELTPRRVQQLAGEGYIPKAERGRYALVGAVRGYIRFLKERAINGDAADGEKDKARLLKARADIAVMEAERLNGTLVAVGDVSRVWMDMIGRTKARMRSIPPKVAPLVSLETDVELNRLTLESHIDEALNELSDTPVIGLDLDPADGADETAEDSPGDAADDEAAAAADDQPMG